MRNFLLFSFGLLLALGCGKAQDAAPAALTTVPAVDSAQPTAAPAPLPAPTFSDLRKLYIPRNLPCDYPYELSGSSKALELHPVSAELATFLVGEEKIEVTEGDQLFALESFSLMGPPIALVTYIKGSGQQQFVLSTHRPEGEMISHVQIWMHAQELSYGYSSFISFQQRIVRNTMITNDAGERDVDSFDAFIIEEDGRISMTEQ